MVSREPVLFAAGYLTTDIMCYVDGPAQWDERITARSVRRTHGGMAANCACMAAQLGTPTWFFGQAESGALGDEAVAALQAAGVETDGVVHVPNGGSLCVILVGPGGERLIVSEPLDFEWDAVDAAIAQWPGDRGAFHVDGYRLPDAVARADAARKAGLLTSVDLDGCDDEDLGAFMGVAEAFDVVFLNQVIAQRVAPEPSDVIGLFVEAGVREAVCLTQGAIGVTVGGPSIAVTRFAPPDVVPVDTTGAGDAFAGAYLHRSLRGGSPADAAQFANAAAAWTTTQTGARGSGQSEAEVYALLSGQTASERQVADHAGPRRP
jgi:sugar/nucleoside kinase (ribokinase family)